MTEPDGTLPPVYLFGRFRLEPAARTLTHAGLPVRLSARLFDTLVYLVEHPGRLVERDELASAVWPGRIVDAGNVAKAISSLRAALAVETEAPSPITTVPARGYQFGAPVTIERDGHPHATEPIVSSDPDPDPDPDAGPEPRAALADGGAGAPGKPRPTWLRPAWLRPAWLPAALGAAGLAVLAAVAIMALVRRPDGVAGDAFWPPPRSVAVLPFESPGRDATDAQFADAVSDEIINALGTVEALRVAGRLSSFSFKGKPAGPGQIGRALDVATVLEGSVRRQGTRVRVTAQLIDTRTGYQIWSEAYDSHQQDLFGLETGIAKAVLSALKVVLADRELAQPAATPAPAALDAYLSGLAAQEGPSKDAETIALGFFDEAIARDAGYAVAYAARSRLLMSKVSQGGYRNQGEHDALVASAFRDARQAVALAPDLGAAHAALASVIRLSLGGFDLAAAELERALALSPGNAGILREYSFLQLDLGHMDRALAVAQHAASLDPLTAGSYYLVSQVLAFGKRYDEAKTALEHARLLRPDDTWNRGRALVRVLRLQGDAAAAQSFCRQQDDDFGLECLAWADHRLGRQAEAEAALRKLQARFGDAAAFNYARILVQWGRQAEGLAWLRKAYETRDPGLIYLKIDPFFDPIRGTAEYRRIEDALRYPP